MAGRRRQIQNGVGANPRHCTGMVNRTQRLVEDNSVQWWSRWAKQAAELQLLRANTENRQKDGDEFYKLDKESIEAIKEELPDDFLSLVEEQLAAVRRLVEQLDDDQLDTQLSFERYERERRQREAAKRTATINISDEEQSSKQMPIKTGTGESQPNITHEEQPKEDHPREPVQARQHQQEELRLVEPEKEGEPVRLGELETTEAGIE